MANIGYTSLFVFLLFLLLRRVIGEGADLASLADSRDNSSSENTEKSTGTREPYIRLVGGLQDISLKSGERLQLRCRVDAWPNNDLRYTWYKDTQPVEEEGDDILIRNRPTGTKLIIRELLTSDAGTYRCEASNGESSVQSTAQIQVSFHLPPIDNDYKTVIPTAKCEEYNGRACHSLLSGKQIYVDPFLSQEDMEEQITLALEKLNEKTVSDDCRIFAYRAFCNFVFSPCEHQYDPNTGKPKAVPIKLCREECELMKYDVCVNEYMRSKTDSFIQKIFETANCSSLPTTTPDMKCTKVGLPSVMNLSHRCFNKSGVDYRGTSSFTKAGRLCNPWPSTMIYEHNELAGGHNFCRNPGGQMDEPWCLIDNNIEAACDVEKCREPSSGLNIIFIIVPCVVAILLIIICIVVVVVCRKRKQPNNSSNGTKVKQSVAYSTKTKLPELHPTVLRMLTNIGDCRYGKVFKAQVLPNPHITANYPMVVKTLRDGSTSQELEDFQKELQVFSDLQHPNVACLKAYVMQPNMRALVFEHTNGVDLHEYLSMHSPQSDFEMAQKNNPDYCGIEEKDFMRIALQIALGMEYLSGKNYIHPDLAARNVLVYESQMEIKISNLGVVRDSYLSCYYRSPQGGQMLPIRWMAPESLHSWKFSDKSTVWSFGVLLWEMFSYGLQPYCGYSNHEVLDMISGRKLLSCPDQCPAKMYSLMKECWTTEPEQRPSFKDLRAKLQGWDTSGTERVTSQLAQGIHRQLANVMKDGSGSGQYHPSHSISGSSGTYNSGSGSLPPPQYSSSGMYPSAPLMLGRQHSNEMSYQPPTGVQPILGDQQFARNYGPREQQYPASTARIIQIPQREHSFPKRPSSQCSRTSSSCSSSVNEKYTASQKLPLLTSITETQDDSRTDAPEQHKEEQHYQEPKLVVRSNLSGRQASEKKENSSEQSRLLDRDSSDRSSNSLRATSCDSGLPVEDVENHHIVSTAPLVGRSPLRVHSKQSKQFA